MTPRKAPPVTYPVGPCVLYGAWLALAAALGTTAVVAQCELSGRLAYGAALALALATGGAVWGWRTQPVGRLCWSAGEGWVWQGDGAAWPLPAPNIAWRGRAWLLLQCPGAPWRLRWLWLERRRDPQHWDAICRAAVAA